MEDETLRNYEEFRRQLPNLIEKGNIGKYAVGRAGEEFDCWTTWEDALRQGYRTFSLNPFVVQKVVENETSELIRFSRS